MDESLSSLYVKADQLRLQLGEGLNGDEYQKRIQECISLFLQCKNLVDRLALFSPNESIEDVSSSELKYFLIDYYLGELTEKRFTTIDERAVILQKANQYYTSFLSLLESYSILPPEPKKSMTAAELRAARIAEYKLQKTLTTKIADLESKLDDEDLRQWALASIELAVIHTRQNLKNIESELEVLASKPQAPIPSEPTSQEYSERLDRIPASSLPKSGPLLSGEGKVLRPFVLTSKRDQLAQGVFRPDHALPTMSIDDYLTEEIRRGGIQLPQEDDGKEKNDRPKTTMEEEEEEDRETEKKREWDEFVESHAKGSGNMGFNRG